MRFVSNYVKLFILAGFIFCQYPLFSQGNAEDFIDTHGPLKYTNLNNWYPRKIKESSFLSGNTIHLFEVGKVDSKANLFDWKIKDPTSPWGTSNVFTKMMFDIGNTRVFPENREDGFSCRLETIIYSKQIAFR